jgi:hypothetical protein
MVCQAIPAEGGRFQGGAYGWIEFPVTVDEAPLLFSVDDLVLRKAGFLDHSVIVHEEQQLSTCKFRTAVAGGRHAEIGLTQVLDSAGSGDLLGTKLHPSRIDDHDFVKCQGKDHRAQRV